MKSDAPAALKKLPVESIARKPHLREADVSGIRPIRRVVTPKRAPKGQIVQLAVAWLAVGIPLAYGVYETLLRAAQLFTG